MFGAGCDQSLITACGLDHRAYRQLLRLFEPMYSRYSPYSCDGRIRLIPITRVGGRPRSTDAKKCLGFHLMWMRSRGLESFLCIIFGITGSVCSLFIRFARRILIRVLSRDTRAAVRLPSDTEYRFYKPPLVTAMRLSLMYFALLMD